MSGFCGDLFAGELFLKKASPAPLKKLCGIGLCGIYRQHDSPRVIFATNKFVGRNKKYSKSKQASFVGYFLLRLKPYFVWLKITLLVRTDASVLRLNINLSIYFTATITSSKISSPATSCRAQGQNEERTVSHLYVNSPFFILFQHT